MGSVQPESSCLMVMSGLNSREPPQRQRVWGDIEKFHDIDRFGGFAVLRDDINNALKDAMKARDERRVSTLRLVNSSLKNADIEARGNGKGPLGDDELLSLLQKMIKQRQESIELYEKGGRPELAAQEQAEIEIISAYLPQQLSDMEAGSAISAIVHEINAQTMKDMSKVMAALKERYAGKLDFGKASAAVKKMLSGG